jgi:hypothetical protein
MKLVTITVILNSRYDEEDLERTISRHVGFYSPVVRQAVVLDEPQERELNRLLDEERDLLLSDASMEDRRLNEDKLRRAICEMSQAYTP